MQNFSKAPKIQHVQSTRPTEINQDMQNFESTAESPNVSFQWRITCSPIRPLILQTKTASIQGRQDLEAEANCLSVRSPSPKATGPIEKSYAKMAQVLGAESQTLTETSPSMPHDRLKVRDLHKRGFAKAFQIQDSYGLILEEEGRGTRAIVVTGRNREL